MTGPIADVLSFETYGGLFRPPAECFALRLNCCGLNMDYAIRLPGRRGGCRSGAAVKMKRLRQRLIKLARRVLLAESVWRFYY